MISYSPLSLILIWIHNVSEKAKDLNSLVHNTVCV